MISAVASQSVTSLTPALGTPASLRPGPGPSGSSRTVITTSNDVSYGEDACTVHTCTGTAVMAALRGFAIGASAWLASQHRRHPNAGDTGSRQAPHYSRSHNLRMPGPWERCCSTNCARCRCPMQVNLLRILAREIRRAGENWQRPHRRSRGRRDEPGSRQGRCGRQIWARSVPPAPSRRNCRPPFESVQNMCTRKLVAGRLAASRGRTVARFSERPRHNLPARDFRCLHRNRANISCLGRY